MHFSIICLELLLEARAIYVWVGAFIHNSTFCGKNIMQSFASNQEYTVYIRLHASGPTQKPYTGPSLIPLLIWTPILMIFVGILRCI